MLMMWISLAFSDTGFRIAMTFGLFQNHDGRNHYYYISYIIMIIRLIRFSTSRKRRRYYAAAMSRTCCDRPLSSLTNNRVRQLIAL